MVKLRIFVQPYHGFEGTVLDPVFDMVVADGNIQDGKTAFLRKKDPAVKCQKRSGPVKAVSLRFYSPEWCGTFCSLTVPGFLLNCICNRVDVFCVRDGSVVGVHRNFLKRSILRQCIPEITVRLCSKLSLPAVLKICAEKTDQIFVVGKLPGLIVDIRSQIQKKGFDTEIVRVGLPPVMVCKERPRAIQKIISQQKNRDKNCNKKYNVKLVLYLDPAEKTGRFLVFHK